LTTSTPLKAHATGAEHHFVLAQGPSRLRLCVIDTPERCDPAYIVPAKSHILARLSAIHAVCRLLDGRKPLRSVVRPPKPYQRHRLIQLLQVLDAHHAGRSARTIAYGLVYPRHTPLIGAAWKASSERRQTLSLIGEAKRMTERNYRKLLTKG
jgi:hypothetical protein